MTMTEAVQDMRLYYHNQVILLIGLGYIPAAWSTTSESQVLLWRQVKHAMMTGFWQSAVDDGHYVVGLVYDSVSQKRLFLEDFVQWLWQMKIPR